jgi:hypothetical protein
MKKKLALVLALALVVFSGCHFGGNLQLGIRKMPEPLTHTQPPQFLQHGWPQQQQQWQQLPQPQWQQAQPNYYYYQAPLNSTQRRSF